VLRPNRRLHRAQQHRQGLLTRRQAGNCLDGLGRQHSAAQRDQRGNKLVVGLREVLHQTSSGARIVLRENQDERTFQLRADGLERGTFDCLAGQRVLDHTHIHTGRARLGAEVGELRDGQATVFRRHYGLR